MEKINPTPLIFGLIGIPSAILCGGIMLGVSHYNSDAYLRGKDLENKCVYISPESGKKVGYKLKDGSVVSVEHLKGSWFFGKDNLEIAIGDICFRSKGISPEDARVLENVSIRNRGRLDSYTKENLKNYYSYQEEYEWLIDKIAERREEFEKNALENIRRE